MINHLAGKKRFPFFNVALRSLALALSFCLLGCGFGKGPVASTDSNAIMGAMDAEYIIVECEVVDVHDEQPPPETPETQGLAKVDPEINHYWTIKGAVKRRFCGEGVKTGDTFVAHVSWEPNPLLVGGSRASAGPTESMFFPIVGQTGIWELQREAVNPQVTLTGNLRYKWHVLGRYSQPFLGCNGVQSREQVNASVRLVALIENLRRASHEQDRVNLLLKALKSDDLYAIEFVGRLLDRCGPVAGYKIAHDIVTDSSVKSATRAIMDYLLVQWDPNIWASSALHLETLKDIAQHALDADDFHAISMVFRRADRFSAAEQLAVERIVVRNMFWGLSDENVLEFSYPKDVVSAVDEAEHFSFYSNLVGHGDNQIIRQWGASALHAMGNGPMAITADQLKELVKLRSSTDDWMVADDLNALIRETEKRNAHGR